MFVLPVLFHENHVTPTNEFERPGVLLFYFVTLKNKLQFGLQMFDEIAAMLYDLVDFRRQWINYISHVKVLQLTDCAKELAPATAQAGDSDQSPSRSRPSAMSSDRDETNKSAANDQDILRRLSESHKNAVDLRIYHETLDGLPTESISVELIFHAILEQVSVLKAKSKIKNASSSYLSLSLRQI